RRQTTEVERIAICYDCASSMSYEDVARKWKCSQSTVTPIHTRYKDKNTIHFLPKSGRPPSLSNDNVQQIVFISDNNPSATLVEVSSMANAGCSVWTIAKRLRENLRFVRSARRKPYLTAERKEKRLKWAFAEENTSVKI